MQSISDVQDQRDSGFAAKRLGNIALRQRVPVKQKIQDIDWFCMWNGKRPDS